jgi:hypothetical protein
VKKNDLIVIAPVSVFEAGVFLWATSLFMTRLEIQGCYKLFLKLEVTMMFISRRKVL